MIREFEERKYKYFINKSYSCEHIADEAIDKCTSHIVSTARYTSLLFDQENAIGKILHGHGNVCFAVTAKTTEDLNRMMNLLQSYAPEDPPAKEDNIYVNFWSLGSSGPECIKRKLDSIPSWHDIYFNYSETARDKLNPLMDPEFRPDKSGQLLLWQGTPGTGKTTALRAMGRECREWCEIHYILDPENFFGGPADYMMKVMAGSGNDWRLLVFEDGGEFLSPDAPIRTGNQGLSRFLNAMDGLIGQGLKFFCLITTNEDLKKLHPAVTRPGRCAQIVEFDVLSTKDIQDWAKHNGINKDQFVKPLTVAELYALKDGTEIAQKRQPIVGFAQ